MIDTKKLTEELAYKYSCQAHTEFTLNGYSKRYKYLIDKSYKLLDELQRM